MEDPTWTEQPLGIESPMYWFWTDFDLEEQEGQAEGLPDWEEESLDLAA